MIKIMPINFWRLTSVGDIAELLCYAHALKEHGYQTQGLISKFNEEIVSACPHIDSMKFFDFHDPYSRVHGIDPYPTIWGQGRAHQVDTLLMHHQITASLEQKTLDINIPAIMQDRVTRTLPATIPGQKRILIHAAKTSRTRTWPEANWVSFVETIGMLGHQLVCVGGKPKNGKGAYHIPGCLDLVGQFSHLEFIALCRISDILVTPDSGPLHLAGASEIGILGLFTVVPGIERIPFRLKGESIIINSPCPKAPCFYITPDENTPPNWGERVWCPKGDWNCEISVEMVLSGFSRLLALQSL